MLPKNFYKDVEQVGHLKYILYSDTDSIFITIPVNVSELVEISQKWDIAEKTAEKINDMIVTYMTQYLLPKQNIDPKYNRTFFKTELVMECMIFLDVKKNYAYKLIIKEGKPVLPPTIQYVNISVKSDISNMTKKLLRDMIENTMLDKNIPTQNKLKELLKVINIYKHQFEEDIKNFQFANIGIPAKWSKRDNVIDAMKVYNYIMGKEVFTPGSAGKSLYCFYRSPMAFKKEFDLTKVKTICVPYEYNAEELKQKMAQFNIAIDTNEQWGKIYSTVCQRIVDLAKKTTG